MKRDSVIKLRDLLNEIGSEVEYLNNDVLKKEKIFVAPNEISFIAKKCLTAYELAVKLKYSK